MKKNSIENILNRIGPSRDPLQCWQWPGCKSANSNPVVRWDGRMMYVSRLLWEHFNPDRIETDAKYTTRTCGNRGCINPAHLQVLTPQEHAAYKARNRGVKQLFTDEEVRAIRYQYARGWTQAELAANAGITQQSMWQIVNRKSYDWVD